ncbi:hypothetical protein KC906_02095, partial [Candidatus Kaiserbacteria bacterium]|nr:hypothetical protein [Candidatus Kaiserbacteria bacterium]
RLLRRHDARQHDRARDDRTLRGIRERHADQGAGLMARCTTVLTIILFACVVMPILLGTMTVEHVIGKATRR